MNRHHKLHRIASLLLVLSIAALPALGQSAKDEAAIRRVVDVLIRGGNSTEASAINAALSHFSTTAGAMYLPNGTVPVAEMRSNPTMGLENVVSRTFEMTSPLRVLATKDLGWASFDWKSTASMKDGSRQDSEGRATLIFNREKKDWKVVHVHFSLPVMMPASAADKAAQAEGILDIERSIWEAFRKGDLTPVEHYFSEDVSVLEGSSAYRMSGKVDILRAFRDMLKDVKMSNYQILDPKVEVHGTAAVLTYYYTESLRAQGMPVNESGKITSVYAMEDGEWRLVHHHSSVNAPEPASGENR